MALILAVIGGFKLLHEGMDFLQDKFDLSGKLLPYLSFLLIFIVIIVLVNLIGRAVKKMLDMTLLGSFDNLAGALIGVFKWAFGLSVLIWIFNYFEINPINQYSEEAILYPMVTSFAPSVVNYISALIPFAEDLFSSVQEIV